MNRARRLLAITCAALLACGLSAALARADERPLTRVVLMPELIPGVVGQLVPITVELAAGRIGPHVTNIKITGLVYCGGDGQKGARSVGTAYPDGAAPTSNVLSTADCQTPLPEIARLARSTGAPA